MHGMFFEDFRVDQAFETKDIVVSRADILSFADAFDPNPFHLDTAEARRRGFPDIIAPGMHTLSISMRLFFELNLWDEAVLPSPGIQNVRWHHPVLPDTRLFVKATVVQVLPSKSKSDRGIVKVHQKTLDRTNDTVLMTVDVMHRLKRRQPGTDPDTKSGAAEGRDAA